METSRSTSGKSNAFTSNASKVLNNDVLFSVQQDFYITAIPPPLCPSYAICGMLNPLQAVFNLPSTVSAQVLNLVSVTIVISVSNDSTNI